MERYREHEVVLNKEESLATHLTSPIQLYRLETLLPVILQMRRKEYVRASCAAEPIVAAIDVKDTIAIIEKMVLQATAMRMGLE